MLFIEIVGAAVGLGLLALYLAILGRGVITVECSQRRSSPCCS